MAVELSTQGLTVDGRHVPLLAGAVHYWRLDVSDWRRALEALRDMGMALVDVYVPWNVHERGPGDLDLGEREPRLDVGRFLLLAHELGLKAIVRPGPHINAELTYFGIPERVVWDGRCQARTPRGNPVILPAPPRMFPVPSYASEAFRDEVARYFELLGRCLAPLVWPNGPIVMAQIDNEGAMYFRDGAYDQDYHPDAINRYREFLRTKYGTLAAVSAAYGSDISRPRREVAEEAGGETAEVRGESDLPFETGALNSGLLAWSDIKPPVAFRATRTDELAHYLDWAEFQEQLLADTFARFRESLVAAGFGGVPTVHNFPPAQETTPLNAARVVQAVDMVGLDYYGKASEAARRDIARRTSELSCHAEARGFSTFACEMGAGFPPIFPPMDEQDNLFTLMCALAYGLRGFNLYMAVDRDRWLGAPIDSHGRRRPLADSYERLARALKECQFFGLRRRAPVRLVMPRSERRLARVMHAFGPVSGAVLAVMGKGVREGCIEEPLGLGYPIAIESEAFLRSFEEALEARGVPYAFVGGELRRAAVESANWIVCATSGGLSHELVSELRGAMGRGAKVTLGPRPPCFDGAWKEFDWAESIQGFSFVERHDPATVDALVGEHIAALELPRFASDPSFVHATVHEGPDGEARVVFLVNGTESDAVARTTIGVDAAWRDPMSGAGVGSDNGMLEVRVKRRSVLMLVRE